MNRPSLVVLGATISLSFATAATVHAGDAPKAPIPAAVRPVLEKYCYSCHDDVKARGKWSFESAPPDFADARWVRVFEKIVSGQMPPQKNKQPSSEERKTIVDWLRRQLHDASVAKQQRDGRVTLRRLNKHEYETTLYDLLGVRLSVKDLLPEDGSAAGFDKVSSALDISSAHLLRYQDAAERALKNVIPRAKPQPFKKRRTGREIAQSARQFAGTLGRTNRVNGDDAIMHVFPYSHIVFGSPPVPAPGRYRVRASMYATGTGGKPIPVRLVHAMEWGKSEKDIRDVRDVPPDKATVIEGEYEMVRGGEVIDFTGWSLPYQRPFEDGHKGKSLDKYTGPALIVQWIEVEGPLDPFPSAGYQRLFRDLPLKPMYTNGPLHVASEKPREDANRLMRAFLPEAFRRPVSAEVADAYIKVVHEALDRKVSFEDAMLLGYRTALCSPHFLFLSEPPLADGKRGSHLDDHALAARLSYFLWCSTPDRELLDLADKQELGKPEVLRKQVERLLSNPKAQRFAQDFTAQWLDLRNIDATFPDPHLYGEFDEFLFWSMPRETRSFFDEMLRSDRSVAEFVHSDWTYLNERLAKHYGIGGVSGGELRQVKLPATSHRGGLLTHASILKVTADGTKTSPVLRGKWVLDRILGQPSPPPPPGISAVEPDIRGATTIRQQLNKHRNTDACASCHRHIDPPGFALESFDVIGGWREFYRSPTYKREALTELPNYPGRQVIRGLDVEKGGQTHDGKSFKDIDDYKRFLLADRDQLARNVVEKLVIYATGADIQFADREAIDQIVAKTRGKNHGLRTLLHEVVQSPMFLNK